MNKDLAGVSAVWRALFGVRVGRFYCSICVLVVLLSKSRRRCFAADYGSVSGDGRRFRCCTVGESLHDCDWVSVRAVQEKCDEKGRSVRFGRAHARDDRGIPPFSQSARKGWGTRSPKASDDALNAESGLFVDPVTTTELH
jgi:hypothetical protein